MSKQPTIGKWYFVLTGIGFIGIFFTISSNKKTGGLIIYGLNQDKKNDIYRKDLGLHLGSDEQIDCEFQLINTSDQTIKIEACRPLQPCCSSIGPLADQVHSLKSIRVPLTLNARNRIGPARYQFIITTSDSKKPVLLIDVHVTLLPQVAVEDVTQSEGSTGDLNTRMLLCREDFSMTRGLSRLELLA